MSDWNHNPTNAGGLPDFSNITSEYTHIINGKPVTSSTFLDVMNPATQKIIAKVPIATQAQVDETVAAAQAAFEGWANTPVDERAMILNKIADAIIQNADEYQKLITLEQGRPTSFKQFEILGAVNRFRETAKLKTPTIVMEDSETHKVIQRYVPLGVCACIVPWQVRCIAGLFQTKELIVTRYRNGPLMLCVAALAPALQAGNTAIVKPSPFTPLTTLRFIRDIQHLLPPGVVSVLSGNDDLGPMITSHPGISKINFTGSSFTGQKVMQSASVGLKRVTLELGGNDPMIILPDVDIKSLVPLVEYAKTIKVGDPTDPATKVGPVQNINQYKRALSYYDEAHTKGFKFALGGNVDHNPTDGLYLPISIIDNPPDDSNLVREEQFAPIVPLLKWAEEKDVIIRANDTVLGLAASVWGKDMEAVQRIALQIQAGTVSMNEFIPFTPGVDFTGHKQSGIGAKGGITGLKEYTNLQTITIRKVPAASPFS
ncbi:aldehyde dehydrogenase family protein [Ceratobasidium sp. AG-Ba]|nr:aldehyde dehydrogenase family protein [Ceratobasidium sp. AG-Ba]QRV99268.1 aldehyde dehydrogenase family protein [Ceratobasidium sp. AG-Ba]QRW13767.1 aldehyde dehydrogenase family protein [Ceratobasidium sp. AG-Ba]